MVQLVSKSLVNVNDLAGELNANDATPASNSDAKPAPERATGPLTFCIGFSPYYVAVGGRRHLIWRSKFRANERLNQKH
jgi:hypothetical protein